jgi:ribosome-binding factor A
MQKEFSRSQRVGELIQRELSDVLRREIYDPGLGMLTISTVEVSPDLKLAKVYITTLGGTRTIAETIQRLNKVAGKLRHHLSQRLTIRATPRLEFVHDASIEYGIKLSALIDSVAPPKENE